MVDVHVGLLLGVLCLRWVESEPRLPRRGSPSDSVPGLVRGSAVEPSSRSVSAGGARWSPRSAARRNDLRRPAARGAGSINSRRPGSTAGAVGGPRLRDGGVAQRRQAPRPRAAGTTGQRRDCGWLSDQDRPVAARDLVVGCGVAKVWTLPMTTHLLLTAQAGVGRSVGRRAHPVGRRQ